MVLYRRGREGGTVLLDVCVCVKTDVRYCKYAGLLFAKDKVVVTLCKKESWTVGVPTC